ncbi:MAG: DsbA family protein [Candidatus Nanohaloarchaeota archaeon QJJ-7]|nr:DsbA family protein [Candidatus Nanohaloarchaeota archaeon QJJ-7]
MKCDKCGREVDSREEEIDHILDQHDDKISSHERDELKRELNQLDSSEKGFSLSSETIATLVLAVGILAALVYISSSSSVIKFNSGSEPTGRTVDAVNMSNGGEPVLGNSSAPVRVTLFEDFECPACRSFDQSVTSRLKSEYVDSGEVKIVWKDFPLTYAGDMHPWSDEAAVAMECVFREGGNDAFWNVKDKVFANQDDLSESNVQDRIVSWAGEEGVAGSDIETCMQDSDAESEVRSDFNEGRNVGVEGTPTVFVNGIQIQKSSYGSVSDAIENELN